MVFFGSHMKPEDVFTPRSAEVNSNMYINRPALESAISGALRRNMHMLIHGESGTGKSWLYKSSLTRLGIPYFVANLANASRLGSVSAELQNLIDREEDASKVSYEEEKLAELSAAVAKAGVSHTGQYEIGKKEPFEACLEFLSKKSDGKQSVLVFDNLEAAFTPPLLKELADIIILCDDERYASYKVKVLIVGVPAGVKEYYYMTPNHMTVANRLTELPEVTRLEKSECDALVERGFVEKLKFKIDDIEDLKSHISWISDRIPQIVHEYCLELALVSEQDRVITSSKVEEANAIWLSGSMYYAYASIESHMNERDTKAARRNQVLYALSLCDGEQFKYTDIESIVRTEFPLSTEMTKLNISAVLTQLSKGDKRLIKRSPKGDAFTFVDPRYRIVLRAMLVKNSQEKVEKKSITRG